MAAPRESEGRATAAEVGGAGPRYREFVALVALMTSLGHQPVRFFDLRKYVLERCDGCFRRRPFGTA